MTAPPRLQIYYAASVRGGNFDRSIYREQIQHLKTFGDVLTEHLGEDSPQTLDLGLGDSDIFRLDEAWLNKADVLVAEVSSASLGVGYQIGQAAAKNKKILCLLHSSRPSLSAMINGNPYLAVRKYSDNEQAKEIITGFLQARKIFLVGPPGSGKGTVAKKLKDEYGLLHISSGDLLREKVAAGDELGKKVKPFMDAGQLVPAELMEELIVDRLTQRDCQTRGYILDGYPPSEADFKNLINHDIFPSQVIILDCSDEIAIERQVGRVSDPITGEIYHSTFAPPPEDIQGRIVKRATDNSEKAAKRLEIFHSQLGNVSSWYPSDIQFRVDASGSAQEVWNGIKEAVERCSIHYPVGSYYLCAAPANENSDRFHSHIDGLSHLTLRTVVDAIQREYPAAQNKIYPVKFLHLGPQTRSEEFSSVYSCMSNFHAIKNAANEAFVTGRMGNDFDYELLRTTLETVDKRTNQNMMSEVEENVYSKSFAIDGSSSVDYDYGFTPATIDWDRLPKWKDRVIPNVPKFELHHGW
jgi:adenylate kinase